MQGVYPPPSLSSPLLVGGPPSEFPAPVFLTCGGGIDPAGGRDMLPPLYPQGATNLPKFAFPVVSPWGGVGHFPLQFYKPLFLLSLC